MHLIYLDLNFRNLNPECIVRAIFWGLKIRNEFWESRKKLIPYFQAPFVINFQRSVQNKPPQNIENRPIPIFSYARKQSINNWKFLNNNSFWIRLNLVFCFGSPSKYWRKKSLLQIMGGEIQRLSWTRETSYSPIRFWNPTYST